ncbi:MAG TPA: BatA domain-containing protein [Vicinamibacterales bacterium]|nr:BatA domain-containing protein [Vicinamibacterales bacterium]
MNFLYPAFLLGALAVAVPVVLHLLRRDVAPDVPFTAVRLLQGSPVDSSRRRHLRDLLLLLARVAALLLLAAAFARPYAPEAAAAATRLRIIAIDRSFSMGAPGRFARALDIARGAVDEAGFADRIAIIAFDERAAVVAPPGNAADARAALGALAVGSGATRYGVMLGKAVELAAGGPATLVVVTDLQRAGWEGEARARVPGAVALDVRDAGTPPDNLAIVALGMQADTVTASVLNASRTARQGVAVVTHDGAPVARASFSAPPDTTVEVPLAWRRASTGTVSVAIDDRAGFSADNARHAVVRGAAAATVMVITSSDASGFFLLRALEAAAEGTLRALPVTTEQIAGARASAIADQSAVVLLSTRNLDRDARAALAAFVTRGGGLLIAASPDVDPAVVSAIFGWNVATLSADPAPRQVSLAATDLRHPMFRPFGSLAANLGQVRFHHAWRVKPDGWQVPARFSDGSPAVLERPLDAGRVVIFASDLDRRWNDFPLHSAYVPFVAEAVRHVAARHTPPQEFLVAHIPAGAKPEPGIQNIDGRTIAVNVDPRESSTGAMTTAEFRGMVEAPTVVAGGMPRQVHAEQTESRQNLWQFGLALMLVALVAESFVGKAQR